MGKQQNVYTSEAPARGVKASPTEPAKITNKQETGDLTISKKVITPVLADENKEYTFTIEQTDRKISRIFQTDRDDATVSFTDGVAEIKVRGGESHTFPGLPRMNGENAVVYTISEDAVTWYDTEISGYHIRNTYKPMMTSV